MLLIETSCELPRHGPLVAAEARRRTGKPGLGKLYRRTEKREQAREYLLSATKLYRKMGMTYWMEKAEAEIRDFGVMDCPAETIAVSE